MIMSEFIELELDFGLYLGKERDKSTETGTNSIYPIAPTGSIYGSSFDALISNEPISVRLFISNDKKICQGEPIIRGTRISVANIVELHNLVGWSIQKIKEEYPFLNDQQIIAALDYYKDHQDEIDSYLEEEKEID